jgi:hypothetical protein
MTRGGGDGGAGDLHGIMAKLWEGLLWIGRGWGGLPTVSRARRRQRAGGDGGSGAWGELRMQEREKWREGELLKVLDQKRRVGEARTALVTMAARWRPGRARAEAGQRGARERSPEERGYGGGQPGGNAW